LTTCHIVWLGILKFVILYSYENWIAWWSVFAGDIMLVAGDIFLSSFVIKYAFYVIFQALGVYFNLYFLIPRFLEKRKYGAYVTLTLLTIIVTALLITPGYYISSLVAGRPFSEMFGVEQFSVLHFFRFNSLASTTAAMTLAMSIKLAKNYINSQNRRQELEQEKLETELKFLKSQFNPHFLFNTINSVFVLIKENQNLAQGTLAKFSDLLRYQLYECNAGVIPLAKEINYIQNFIDLEKLRQNDNVNVETNFDSLDCANYNIHPFILMPLIENAFKHVSNHEHAGNYIDIHIKTLNQQLHFQVENSVASDIKRNGLVKNQGIGLANVERRLALLYPENHKLEIKKEGDIFSCKLVVDLESVKSLSMVEV